MHVLLTILKILGISLGSILGVVLLLVLTVLIVPVRYAGNVSKHDKLVFKARASWLLHILHVTFEYDDKETALSVKVFGKTVYPAKTKPAKKKKKAKPHKASNAAKTSASTVTEKAENGSTTEESGATTAESSSTAAVPGSTAAEPLTNGKPLPEERPLQEEKTSAEEFTSEEEPEDFIEKAFDTVDDGLDKIEDTVDGIADKIENIYDSVAEKLSSIYNKWVKLKSIIDDERVQKTVRLVLKKAGRLLKHVLPRRISGTFDYGFEDPSVTGYITAVCGALYGRLGRAFTFRPDFENKKLEADAKFSGKIRLGYIAAVALRVYLNKDFKYSLKLAKTFKEEAAPAGKTGQDDEADISSDFYDDLEL